VDVAWTWTALLLKRNPEQGAAVHVHDHVGDHVRVGVGSERDPNYW